VFPSFPIIPDPKLVRVGDTLMVHHQLRHEVDYHPFPPNESVAGLGAPPPPKEHLVRMFVGQIPYNLSDSAFLFSIGFMTGGRKMYHFERILKRGRPAGCLYAFCAPEDVDAILSSSHRILFDDGGFWAPGNEKQAARLRRHLNILSQNEQMRPVVIPWQTMTVEVSRSQAHQFHNPPTAPHHLQQNFDVSISKAEGNPPPFSW
jgi:hypothetical protein